MLQPYRVIYSLHIHLAPTLCYAQPYRIQYSLHIHLAPTHWYNNIEIHTHCTSTLHPPYVTPSHIECNTHCISTLHAPTVMPSHIIIYWLRVHPATVNSSLANHHHSSLCCCSIVQTVRPGSSHNICLVSSGLSDSLATVRIASLLRPVTIRTITFC